MTPRSAGSWILLLSLTACGGGEFQAARVDDAAVGDQQTSGPEASAADDGHDDAHDDGDARAPARDAGTDSRDDVNIVASDAALDAVDACTLVQHSDGPGPTATTGLGQTFSDCVPLGTYNQQLADDACQAWGAANGGITMHVDTFPCADGTQEAYCVSKYGSVARWGFSGPAMGHVCVSCGSCATSSDPTYE